MDALESKNLLSQAFKALENHGDLIDVDVTVEDLNIDKYLSVGQWIDTANNLNHKADFKIHKIFFAQNNPVIVFANASKTDKEKLYEVYNSLWSFARPRLAFIEHDSVVDLYDLAQGAARNNTELKPLKSRISDVIELVELIKSFTQENILSGKIFGDERFQIFNKRADQALISDLKTVRQSLFDNGLKGAKLKYAHALIGRAIFIRYLEDRGVLDKDYFLKVAGHNKTWQNIVNTPLQFSFYRSEMSEKIFPRILSDKNLTFAFFKRLSQDFNGDTFITDDNEEDVIKEKHLSLLADFLIGKGTTTQQSFFLWAYRFDVIPVDLISSIYEEFYHTLNTSENRLVDGKGTHYTPSSLVDYVLSKVLTASALSSKPRILDPACGSGIFLVEAFRRLVRYRLYEQKGGHLEASELLAILKNQIAGIEINPEAIKIAAFSLYLSFLNYLKPPNILQYIRSGNKLPNLICSSRKGVNNFNNLVEANTFSTDVVDKIFPSKSFDIVIGNPPWGTPKRTDVAARQALDVIQQWCDANDRLFPDKEPSHAFIWRAIDLLKENGICALLVSSGILYKFSNISNQYKLSLLSSYTVSEVISFANVRSVFFSGAISPFVFIKIKNAIPEKAYSVKYTALKNSFLVSKNKVVITDSNDVKYISSDQVSVGNVWKIYHWGNDYDFKLISAIKRFQKLSYYANTKVSAQGFQVANKSKSADWLNNYSQLPVEYFNNKYQSINLNNKEDREKLAEIPSKVKVRGNEHIFQGPRIVVRRGILQSVQPKGQIIVRVERDKFAFNHSLICIKLDSEYSHETELFAALMWSSLFRYYMFMTASTWGTWHQELHLNEVLDFPIAMPDPKLKSRILAKASELSELNKPKVLSSRSFDQAGIETAEKELDLLVFELYRLTKFEQHLVWERCKMDIDLYYNGLDSFAASANKSTKDFKGYINFFITQWSKYLDSDEYFKPTLVNFSKEDWVAIVFTLQSKSTASDTSEITTVTDPEFSTVERLYDLRSSAEVTYEASIRSVSRDEIIIIKRNQKRLWNITHAQLDVEATLLVAMDKPVTAQ